MTASLISLKLIIHSKVKLPHLMDKSDSQGNLDNDSEKRHENHHVIDLVGEIFQNLSKNMAIPKEISHELSKLKTSYLKIALDTPNLLLLENHQARIFLKNIVNITDELNSKNKISELYTKKIISLVDQINKSTAYDSKLYIKLENDLENFIKRQTKREEIKKKREKEKQLGLEKIKQAKNSAKQILQDRVTNKNLPQFVKQIIIKEWLNVLVLMYLRNESESQEQQLLQDSIDFIDVLIKYTDSQSELIISSDQLSILVKKYQKGLQLVAFNSSDIDSKSKEFINNVELLEKSKSSKINVEKKQDIINPRDIVEISSLKKQQKTDNLQSTIKIEKETRILKKEIKIDYEKLIDSLKQGDWFNISLKENKVIKAKLSWISPITGKFLFVDLNGLKITNKTRSGLKDALKGQSIKVINH